MLYFKYSRVWWLTRLFASAQLFAIENEADHPLVSSGLCCLSIYGSVSINYSCQKIVFRRILTHTMHRYSGRSSFPRINYFKLEFNTNSIRQYLLKTEVHIFQKLSFELKLRKYQGNSFSF